jgi:hypothetical protein
MEEADHDPIPVLQVSEFACATSLARKLLPLPDEIVGILPIVEFGRLVLDLPPKYGPSAGLE